MSKKGWKAGAVLAAGAGITAVLAAKKRGNMEMDKMKKTSHGSRSDYRNTELGKHDKNSKGIYYTNGNYEAFARPEKPAGIEEKSGRPPIWWINLWKYRFISRALCQFSKANMVLQ